MLVKNHQQRFFTRIFNNLFFLISIIFCESHKVLQINYSSEKSISHFFSKFRDRKFQCGIFLVRIITLHVSKICSKFLSQYPPSPLSFFYSLLFSLARLRIFQSRRKIVVVLMKIVKENSLKWNFSIWFTCHKFQNEKFFFLGDGINRL